MWMIFKRDFCSAKGCKARFCFIGRPCVAQVLNEENVIWNSSFRNAGGATLKSRVGDRRWNCPGTVSSKKPFNEGEKQ